MEELFNSYLRTVEYRLARSVAHDVAPLPIDRWTASSLLQKAIRRGDGDMATRAAWALYRHQPASVWRRLVVVAFEDVGIGSVETVIATTAACVNAGWRHRTGDPFGIIAVLTEMLAAAPKDRCADYLICAAQRHPDLSRLRQAMRDAPANERTAIVANPRVPILERAVAAWLASGLGGRAGKHVAGDLPALLAAYGHLGVSEALTAATGLAARRCREPIVAMLPLIWDAQMHCGPATVSEHILQTTCSRDGVPLYAFDQFTRLGRQAIASFALDNADVRRVLESFVPAGKRPWATEVAVFYMDSAPVSRRLEWSRSAELEAVAIEADLVPHGMPAEAIPLLMDAVSANLSHLNQIRDDLLRRTPMGRPGS